MALQLYDGFEIAPTQRNGLTCSSGVLVSNTGRTGGKSVGLSASGANTQIPLPTPAAICYVGIAFKETGSAWGSTSAGAYLLNTWGDAGAVQHVTINVSNDGHITVRRGGANGTIIATSTLTITANAWHYLEARIVVSDASGEVIVRVDGAEYINATGLDTKNGGTATTVSTIGFGQFGSCVYDDLYVCDGTGAAPYNTFLGDKVIRRATPDGAGASTGFTPSAGSNYQCVDEDPWTTADYVAAAAAATDLYSHSDVSGFSSVDATQVITYSLKTDAGARTLRTVTRSAVGTSAESADLALPTSVAVVQGPIRQTDPDGAAWTQSLVNSAQYGVKAV
jgi:hypothetical protein